MRKQAIDHATLWKKLLVSLIYGMQLMFYSPFTYNSVCNRCQVLGMVELFHSWGKVKLHFPVAFSIIRWKAKRTSIWIA